MDTRELRKFAFILTAVCAALGALRLRAGSETLHIIFFSVSGYALISAVFHPRLITPIYALLTKVGHVIGAVMTTLVLGILFYFILTPIGILLRIFGKDLLNIRIRPGDGTYWVPRERKDLDPKRYENQF